MHLNNKILIINFYFSKVDKRLTEWVGIKNKPVADKTYDNIETEDKVFYILGFFSEKHYLQYETV